MLSRPEHSPRFLPRPAAASYRFGAMQRTPQAPAAARPTLPADLAAALLVAAAAAFVFRGTLRYGFSQDDFTGLARAAGPAPRLPGPWRWISQQLFFDAMRRAARLDAAAYHAVPP